MCVCVCVRVCVCVCVCVCECVCDNINMNIYIYIYIYIFIYTYILHTDDRPLSLIWGQKPVLLAGINTVEVIISEIYSLKYNWFLLSTLVRLTTGW